jgi:acyl transferase domain-containing protein/acyl-CoA synthetase (AMP-forming)/AMP-acid ligase II/acyl carrier protein
MSQKNPDIPFFATLVDMLRFWAEDHGSLPVYTFLLDGDLQESSITCRQLDSQARRIGALLQQRKLKGERALLLYAPGLDYISAFFGCLYAGVIAVPAYPPDPSRLARTLPRLKAIIKDSGAQWVLTTGTIQSMAEAFFSQDPELKGLQWQSTDGLEETLAKDWREGDASSESLVFLQYTSGSTGSPKGVMLAHRNLIHNLHLIHRAFELDSECFGVSWLPPYHDMGLIGSILEPLYVGGRTVLFSPLDFLKRPHLWLKAVSRYGGTTSGGPNFAYDLCIRKVTEEQKRELDLSSWDLAFSGAEPIRPETLDRFVEAFGPCGFRREAFYPCYGLAEATLIVSGGKKSEPPVMGAILRKGLETHRAVTAASGDEGAQILVGCGRSLGNQKIRIVNPETLKPCSEGEVGEIWVSGDSVALGYWNQQELSEKTFQAHVRERSNDVPFLRSGDLGFLQDEELYVTGRIKDLIIIRGQNHYPQDIELTIEKRNSTFRPGCGAAFTVEREGEERLTVVWEVDLPEDSAEGIARAESLIAEIRQAVAEGHEIQAEGVVLVRKGSIPKTSSGKIQRHACQAAYLAGELEAIAAWKGKKDKKPLLETPKAASAGRIFEIRAWLTEQLATRLGVSPSEIDPQAPFTRLGLDSKEAVSLSGSLEDWLGRRLSPTLLWQYPTLEALAGHLGIEEGSLVPLARRESDAASEPIAVIGLSCRFPHAPDLEAFWRLLRDGVDGVTEVPPDRWNVKSFYSPQPSMPGKMNTRWGSFLDKVDHFDAGFFGISPREALKMDPQQRLLMEVSWEALENGEQVPSRMAGSPTGVFIGIGGTDYSRFQFDSLRQVDAYAGTGNAHSIAANRLSYFFDFKGPSLSVDTACSSSLVAVHLACQSLRRGEARMALAGGVNLILSPEVTIAFSQARMMSSKGRCFTFDAEADGYVRGEGCGVVVLKRLSDALADGDPVWAVIRGTAVNQDGRSNGLTAPNGLAQQAVIREALKDAGLKPSDLSYMEAHGTGTPLGDPIEMQALGAVLKEGRSEGEKCLVGSVKTNIGHLEVAAGIAGIVKVILSLRHREIPPHLHLKKVNEHIPLDQLPLAIPREKRPWISDGAPRRAGVNSFGFGGTNAHVIIEEPPEISPLAEARYAAGSERPSLRILKLSARTEAALKSYGARWERDLETRSSENLADLCFSANAGRADFEHRLIVLCDSIESLRDGLAAFARGEKSSRVRSSHVKHSRRARIGFLFTGQGSQYPGMGRRLYETRPLFKKILDQCDEVLRPHLEHSLLSVLFPSENEKGLIHETAYTQPALFALEYALAQLWRSWGIVPDFVMGHSVGEYVAACVAGVLSWEEGLRCIAHRGRLMQDLPKDGRMLAVRADEKTVVEMIAPFLQEVSIAAVNGPQSLVLSGRRERVEALEEEFRARGIGTQFLTVSHAFHSPLMDPILDSFEKSVGDISFQAPRLPLVSNLTGKLFEPECRPDAVYWRRHMREAVRFAAGMETLAAQGCEMFLEVGPEPVLIGMGRKCLVSESAGPRRLWLRSLMQGRDDEEVLLESLGDLYLKGCEVDWRSVEGEGIRRGVPVPTYPFEAEAKRYWFQPSKEDHFARRGGRDSSFHPLLGIPVPSPLRSRSFETVLDLESFPFLKDHRVSGECIFPAAAYVEMALACVREGLEKNGSSWDVQDLTLSKALFLKEEPSSSRTVQWVLSPESVGGPSFEMFSLENGNGAGPSWTLHAKGRLSPSPHDERSAGERSLLEEIRSRCPEERSVSAFYEALRKNGLEYGAAFRGVGQLWKGQREALGRIRLPQSLEGTDGYQTHPALLDAAFQVLAAAVSPENEEGNGAPSLPVGFGRIKFHGNLPSEFWSHAVWRDKAGLAAGETEADLRLLDDEGKILLEVEGLKLKALEYAGSRRQISASRGDSWLYELKWRRKDLKSSPPRAQEKGGPWLIFMDQQGVGDSLARAFRARGERCVGVRAGEAYQVLDPDLYLIRPDHPEDYARLLREAFDHSPNPWNGLLHLWSLDGPEAPTQKNLERAQDRDCLGLLHLIQALGGLIGAVSPRLWLITRGAQTVEEEKRPVSLEAATLWGMGRVIALEHPELQCVRIDFSSATDPTETDALLQEVISTDPDGEDQIALRGQERFVARWVRAPLAQAAETAVVSKKILDLPSAEAYRLEISQAGALEGVDLKPCGRIEPGPGEIEIEVFAAGLNFSDVLKVLGLYPGLGSGPVPIGIECSGKIVRVGTGVKNLKTGDEVAAVAPFCFGKFVTTRSDYVLKKPDSMSFEEAATLPIAFLTAHYALNHLGRMDKGEKVLIHAGAGGVGIAAIQLAQAAGAEVFATAGSPEKRDFLKKNLGVKHVFDSRSLDFAEEILKITESRGVDLVLNSLPGEFISKSLSVLAPHGRFLEIGKIDIYQNTPMGLLPFQKSLSYFAIDLDRLLRERPELIRGLMAELNSFFREGSLTPLPLQVFPLRRAVNAFRFMAQRKNTGKVILSVKEDSKNAVESEGAPLFRPDAAYLITGGLGSLGLRVAHWMVHQGARRLVLLGRKGADLKAREKLEELAKSGVQVRVFEADVSDGEQLDRVLEEIRKTMGPLRGIVHAAGVLRDGILLQLDAEKFRTVLAPKVQGAWNLHALTLKDPLDFFILFSSIASVLGSPGQANYAAANAFLDALAHERHRLGLPALSVNWGPWSDGGMASGLSAKGGQEASLLKFLSTEQGLQFLGRLLKEDSVQKAVVEADWKKLSKAYRPGKKIPLFSDCVEEDEGSQGSPSAAGSGLPTGFDREKFLSLPAEERESQLTQLIRSHVARVLDMEPDRLDLELPLNTLGLDSLMAIEMKNQIESTLRVSLPIATLIKGPNITQLVQHLLNQLQPVSRLHPQEGVQPEKSS